MTESYQSIVIGLGAMGSASVYQLVQSGQDVLGIDQYDPPHTKGSSHGQTRLTRLAVGEGESYVPLVRRSHEIWKHLEQETNKSHLHECGGLLISSEAQTGVNHVKNLFTNTVSLAKKHGIEHETLTAEEIRARFPHFVVDDDEKGYYEYNAGYVFPDRCIHTQLDLASKHGAEIHTNEKMVDFTVGSNSVSVKTDNNNYATDNLVLAVGPWLSKLVSDEIGKFFDVYRQVLYWFDTQPSNLSFASDTFPVFVWELKGGKRGMYGFPAIDNEGRQIKVATDQYQTTTDPDKLDKSVTQKEADSFYRTHLGGNIRGVENECMQAEACMYTVTPDSGFVIDHHPDHENVVIVSPCSGHGFKHSAAIGEAVSELVTAGESTFDLEAFSLDRFGSSK